MSIVDELVKIALLGATWVRSCSSQSNAGTGPTGPTGATGAEPPP